MADDEKSSPGTAAFVPDFDTGEQSQPLKSAPAEHDPGTAAFVPDFDTGEQSQPLKSAPAEHDPGTGEMAALKAAQRSDVPDRTAIAASDAGAPVTEAPSALPAEPLPPPVQPVTVPGRYYYLRWWKFVLLLIGVWIVAAALGLVLFSWWYQADNKTPALFVVLVYTMMTTVGALMLAMIPGRPLLSALAIALSSAVFASLAAVAPVYGHHHCERTHHCVAGFVPY
ncbi:MAG TPA: hypothetical protein VMS16_05885 [Mycobacterium sp.]|nr:hypothetical protein [Mycobacterium sp.]